jgi:hypothetical protein
VKVKKFKNKDLCFELPRTITHKYIDTVLPFAITPAPQQHPVKRKFIAEKYGGNRQCFIQKGKAELNPTARETRFMVFPNIELNPLLPQIPGHAGLLFASRRDLFDEPPVKTLFVKADEAKNLWLYLGEYKFFLCQEKIAEDLWRNQPDEVRPTCAAPIWAK